MTKTIEPVEPHVLIIGAGITGLILAQALKKEGIRFTIFERDASLNVRSNEWTMAIHWSLERLATLLPAEVYRHMEEASCNPAVPIDTGGRYPIIHAETGRLLAGVPYKRGLRVPRSKMRALCGQGIDVQYGKTLKDVDFSEDERSFTATFADGTVVPGTLLVGADGTRSRVRTLALKSEEAAATTPFPIWHMNLTVCYKDAEKAQFVRRDFPTSFLALSERSFHAFQSISSMPDGPEHPETWIFHLAMAWRGEAQHDLSQKERLAIIKEKASSLAEPARSSFLWIPEDTLVHKADISYWITQPWDNRGGRMTLIGDAAHPMPPYRGQGLNHCIADCFSLANSIKGAVEDCNWSAAIEEYEKELVPRGAEEVKCSIENGIMLHDWSKVRQSPVFTEGFRPMKGHDAYETNTNSAENLRLAEVARGINVKT
ncbi:Hypothetical protein R9X50_00414800 [Acrodontium crateriforme]|uniref:FAD-binding domain-containing protein n=1 Tax=Acrodontium crateriforme TaxID=150365 RepID=A0AAQ3M484_9PEZI|nr:Hypothetical protein R9X50_00414800 [Acrodontium crateriforme]